MPLTVTAIESQREKNIPGKGDFISWKLTVKDDTGEHSGVELFQRKDSVPPAVGQVIDGTIEQGQFGPKIRKAAKMGGGFGRQRDPKESARIVRQHSQEMAIRWTVVAHSRGLLPETFKLNDLEQVIDWFQRDVEKEPVQLGKARVKDTVKTGESDLGQPAQADFEHPKTDLEGTPWAA